MIAESAEDPQWLGAAIRRVSEAVARVYAEEFGRGPLEAETSIRGDVVLTVLREILSPGEKVLCAAGRKDTVLAARTLWREATERAFDAAVERALGRPVLAAISGVDFEHDMATETFILAPPPAPGG